MNADELLQNVKDRAGLPTGLAALSDTKILNAATEEMRALVVPILAALGEEYFTEWLDLPVRAGYAYCDMPPLAVGSALRKVAYLDASGTEMWQQLPRVSMADTGLWGATTAPTPAGFYPTATGLTLVPTPSQTGTLRVWYSRRPGALVAGTSAAVAAAVYLGGGINIVSGALPASFVVGARYDIYRAGAPSGAVATGVISTAITATFAGFSPLARNGSSPVAAGAQFSYASGTRIVEVLVAGTTSSAEPASPTDPNASALCLDGTAIGRTVWSPYANPTSSTPGLYTMPGDVLTLSGAAYYPQIPLEWHSVLELRTCARVAAILGKTKVQQECLANAAELTRGLVKISAPRSAMNQKKISSWRP